MVRIRQSTIIHAPIERVWQILRDFNGHDRWHPAIAASHIEEDEPSTRIGAVRNFRLADGSVLREQLLAMSDEATSFSYCLLEAPIPLMGYVAHVRLKPVTDSDETFWEWTSTFTPPASRKAELTGMVTRDIYQAGFAAIERLVGAGRRSTEPVARLAPAVQSSEMGRTPVAAAPVPDLPAAKASSEMTDAIMVDRYGGPEVMRFTSIELPMPAPDEVRIRQSFVGVNYIDIYCRTGFFSLIQPPGVPGMEAAGVVERVGSGVRDLAVGDRVAYACPPVGAYAARRNMKTDLLVKLPSHVSEEIAAASLLKGITASFLLNEIARVKPGDVVLMHAAAGGVGQLVVQWARSLGATVIATVSNDEKARIAERLGAHHVINYRRQDFASAVQSITRGRGADVIFDAVGRDTLQGSIDALAIRGHLVSFGQASGSIGSWDIDSFASKSITFSRPNYGHYTDTSEKLGRHVGAFFEMLGQGLIKVDAPTRFELRNAADAHRHIESRGSTGSTVLVV